MSVPDPFGMRWFGLFAITVISMAIVRTVVDEPLIRIVALGLVVGTGLCLMLASSLSGVANKWLLGRWFRD